MHIYGNGNICFGVQLVQGQTLPWSEKYDGEAEEWYLKEVVPFKPTVDIYADGFKPTKEQREFYFSELRDAKQRAVSVVNIQMTEYPAYILALTKTVIHASNGSPTIFDPAKLVVTNQEVNDFIDLCSKYKIKYLNKTPRWYLSAYWDM